MDSHGDAPPPTEQLASPSIEPTPAPAAAPPAGPLAPLAEPLASLAEPLAPLAEPVAPVAAPRRRRRATLVAIGAVVAVVVAAVPVVLYVTGGAAPVAAPPAASAPASASPTPLTTPGPDAPVAERHAWARAKITESLAAQSQAMHAGDLRGYLAPAGGDRAVERELKRRYDSMRAMKVGGYRLLIDTGPVDEKQVGGFSDWAVKIAVEHCFGAAGCRADTVLVDSRWRDSADGYRLVTLGAVAEDLNGPHPWEVSELTAVTGSRVTIATTRAYAAQARAMLGMAERAAKVADRYGLGDKPERYVVYLAGDREWKRWFGGFDIGWVVGFALPVTDERSDIVIRAEESRDGDVESLLRHEMAHVATLAGREFIESLGPNWWLSEGIAEYVRQHDTSVGAYFAQDDVRRFLETTRYNGNLMTLLPGDDDDWEVSARYGLGYYAAHCISARFGEKQLMAFADSALRFGLPTDAAAETVLDIEWSELTEHCLDYTERAVG